MAKSINVTHKSLQVSKYVREPADHRCRSLYCYSAVQSTNNT